ncbi:MULTISPECIES: hypothetical protein [Chryseobacterium]|nr:MULTISPECIES: hypothetical protein [Chryseobacterium]
MEKAPDFMFSSVYAYRIIPNYLSVHVTEAFTALVNTFPPFVKSFLLKSGTLFYHSIFLINSLFFVLSSWILDRILRLEPTDLLANGMVRRLIHLICIFFLVIVQYVPTNCDSIAVFFYLGGIFFSLKYFKNRNSRDLIVLAIIIFISTMVRETACLNIAFFAALYIDLRMFKAVDYKVFKDILLLVLAFVVPYAGLRIAIPQQASFFEGIYLLKNFTSPYNLAGLLFGIAGIYFGYRMADGAGKIMIKRYLFFSLPYLIMIALVGLFWETRLFIPLILTAIIIASYQFKKYCPQ